MQITHCQIANYKSLRFLDVVPKPLTIVVGANGSGKSNLADCLDFISEVYRFGLEDAVSRKGGYENIAHRKIRRTKSAVSITIGARLVASEYQSWIRGPHAARLPALNVEHTFSFVAIGQSISAEFKILRETIRIRMAGNATAPDLMSVTRESDSTKVHTDIPKRLQSSFELLLDKRYFERAPETRSKRSTELLMTGVGRLVPILRLFAGAVGRMRVFQITPNVSRIWNSNTQRRTPKNRW